MLVGKSLKMSEREWDEFNLAYRSVIGQHLADMYINPNGSLTLRFGNGTTITLGASVTFWPKVAFKVASKKEAS